VAIDNQYADDARSAIDGMFSFEIATGKVNPIRVERDLAIVAVVGENMRSHTGVSGKMFAALGHNGINVSAIAQGSSEMNISAVIATADVKKAINVLHEAFFESVFREINLYIAGIGNVGARLLQQLHSQQQYLQEQLRVQINLVGAINSRFMVVDERGLSPEKLSGAMSTGESANLGRFVDIIIERNLRNSVFVDITASELVPALYPQLLKKCVAVVACNKIACSSPHAFYALLKQLAAEYGTDFFFETNVGASLPVISTLNDLLRSGDRVHKIEAVLSGTLNFVFNRYDGSRSFASVVREAQEGGYTEPDPRLDLSGQDVARKIMILVREAGYPIEMEDVENTAFMPAACMQGSVEDFYRSVEHHESHFRELYRSAAEAGKKLKFVARFENGRASVGLQHIAAEHDFYHLYGKDNIVLFHTDRYAEYPLVIKGAGAGADVTASGIFADILRTVR
jgi:aspartokinase/homoserine dehydrogenase 1